MTVTGARMDAPDGAGHHMSDTEGTTESTAATVAAGDIARLAGVGKAAVSNWRRRFDDFPEPVGGTAASPLYSLADVEAWLTRHGKRFRIRPGDRLWQLVRGAADDLRLGELVGCVGAFLLLLRRDPERWARLAGLPDEELAERVMPAVAAAAPEVPGLAPGPIEEAWAGVLRAAADLAAGDPAALFDFLCDRYLEAHARRLPTTPRQIAGLMVELAGVTRGTVLDPACGTGTLLHAARARGATRLLGQELNETAARLTVVRLLLHGAPVQVAAGDSLRADAFPGERADVVVCNPPFGERSWGFDELASDPRWEHGLPPRGEPELAWVQHCLAHVEPGGRVVVLMPAAAASRRSGRRIRANLLRAGALRAVIGLPAGTPAAGPAPDLWVLRRPHPDDRAPSHLLVVDATGDLRDAVRAWRSFQNDPEGDTPGRSRSLRIIDLLDDEVDLSPARHLATSTSEDAAERFTQARARLADLLAGLPAALPELAAPGERHEPAMTTVGELVRAGLVTARQAPLRMTLDSGELPVLMGKDVARGRDPSGRTVPDEPGAVPLRPGDVVVPVLARHAVVRVISEGGAVLGPNLLLFRADPDHVDPYFLAGFLRVAGMSGMARASASSHRIDPRRAPIPRLPLADQREYGEAFRRLAALEDALREATVLGEALIQAGFTGLADGVLRP